MRKLFVEHPFFASCFTILFSIFLFITIVISSVIYLGYKSLKGVSEELASIEEVKSNSEYSFIEGKKDSKNKILYIDISGMILTNEINPIITLLGNYTYGYSVQKKLLSAAADPEIKAVFIEVDSPGGTVTGAKAIEAGVRAVQSAGKKVYAYTSGLLASGGYYAAASSDKIFADGGTLTGSIGVIMGPFKYYDKVVAESDYQSSIQTLNGIQTFNITAGLDKDMGNPYKQMDEKTKAHLQSLVDSEYNIFAKLVSDSRDIPIDKVKNEIGATVYSPEQAVELGLVDLVVEKKDALIFLVFESGIPRDDYQVVGSKSNDFISTLLQGAVSKDFTADVSTILTQRPLYLTQSAYIEALR